jgi:hypothetical protein
MMMKVTIKVAQGESAVDAKRLRKLIQELNYAPHPIIHIHYQSEYGEIGHPPYQEAER